jgi:hypothetical protein
VSDNCVKVGIIFEEETKTTKENYIGKERNIR